jgi:preprotein translocase subunit SecE
LSKKGQSQVSKPAKPRFGFIRDIIDELKKVVWPTRRELSRLTLMVIAICVAVGLFLGLLDFGFAELVTKVFLGGS